MVDSVHNCRRPGCNLWLICLVSLAFLCPATLWLSLSLCIYQGGAPHTKVIYIKVISAANLRLLRLAKLLLASLAPHRINCKSPALGGETGGAEKKTEKGKRRNKEGEEANAKIGFVFILNSDVPAMSAGPHQNTPDPSAVLAQSLEENKQRLARK